MTKAKSVQLRSLVPNLIADVEIENVIDNAEPATMVQRPVSRLFWPGCGCGRD